MMHSEEYDYIFMDINAIGYANMYQPGVAKLQYNGVSTAALHGVMFSLRAALREHPQAVPVVLWDGAKPWRYEVFTDYKSDRGADPEKAKVREAYAKQLPTLRKLIRSVGIVQVYHDELEADDLMGLMRQSLPEDKLALMLTRDEDWFQGMSEQIDYMNFQTKQIFELNDVFGADRDFDDVEQFIIAKSISGDISDSIPGVNGIGMKKVVKALRLYGSLENLKLAAEQKLSPELNKKALRTTEQAILSGVEGLLEKNRALIDWNAPNQVEGMPYFCMSKPNKSVGEAICEEYRLDSAKSSISDLVERFNVEHIDSVKTIHDTMKRCKQGARNAFKI